MYHFVQVPENQICKWVERLIAFSLAAMNVALLHPLLTLSWEACAYLQALPRMTLITSAAWETHSPHAVAWGFVYNLILSDISQVILSISKSMTVISAESR